MTTAPPAKALTLWQPWATLIALLLKRHETRSWATKYRGWLWIHASARRPTFDDMRTVVDDLDAWNAWHAAGLVHDRKVNSGPLGAFVARARLVDVIPTDQPRLHDADLEAQLPYGDYTPGRHAWIFDAIEPLPEPVPARGAQGLWTIDAETAVQLDHALTR